MGSGNGCEISSNPFEGPILGQQQLLTSHVLFCIVAIIASVSTFLIHSPSHCFLWTLALSTEDSSVLLLQFFLEFFFLIQDSIFYSSNLIYSQLNL